MRLRLRLRLRLDSEPRLMYVTRVSSQFLCRLNSIQLKFHLDEGVR